MGKRADREAKLLAAAMAAVMLAEREGEALGPSGLREAGNPWSRDHSRVLIVRRNLYRARTRRSTTR